MSTIAADATLEAEPRAAAPAEPRSAHAVVALGTFFALSAFAVVEYAQLLIHPPLGRLLGLVALVTAGSGLLAPTARRSGATGASVRALLVLVTLVLALIVLGVPSRLLAPWHWGAFARHVHHGLHGLDRWLWPYRGSATWARLVALLPVPFALLLAGAVRFWPTGRRPPEIRAVPLLTLAGLFIAGAANSSGAAPGLRGLVLLLLMGGWLWLPRVARTEAPRAARWLVLCAALGLLAEPLLSSSQPWIAYRTATAAAGSTTFQWDQLYGPIGWSRSSAAMFEVSEAHPTLMRVTSLDRFDGLRFLRSDSPPGEESLDLPPDAAVKHDWVQRATVTVDGLDSRLLVDGGGVQTALRWLTDDVPAIQREADGTVLARSPPSTDRVYEVSSYQPAPSASQLRAAPRTFPIRYLPYVQFELPAPSASGLHAVDLSAEASAPPAGRTVGAAAPGGRPGAEPATAARIEASPYARMFALAQQLASGASSAYEVVQRIKGYLLANYTYDENVPAARYPLEAFLFSERRGYCQQFSGAMALMLRMEGIPARVGEGFKPQIYDPDDGSWTVRALDAHAWVEVFFSGIGWVSFDPTPAAPDITSEPNLSEPVSKAQQLGQGKHAGRHRKRRSGRVTSALRTRSHGSDLAAVLGLALAAAIALALLVALLVGRLRLRRSLAGDGEGAVAELCRVLEAEAHGQPAMTLTRLEAELSGRRQEAARRYVVALRELRYAPRETPPPTARGRSALRRALAGRLSLRGRIRLLAMMPPGIARRRPA